MKYKVLSFMFSLFCFFGVIGHVLADNGFPEIGKKIETFNFKNIKYYKHRSIPIDSFKGKWLILDVWDKHCTTCIASLPKMDSLQNKFSDEIQIVMVAPPDVENEKIYDRFREKMKLNLPGAFEDSIYERFDIAALPFIIVVDPGGIVKAVTYRVNFDDINDFLQGRTPVLPRIYGKTEQDKIHSRYDSKIPYLINGNGGAEDHILYRSLLTITDKPTEGFPSRIGLDKYGKFELLGVDLNFLYMYAFIGRYPHWGPRDSLYGKFSPRVEWQPVDPSYSSQNEKGGEKFYCYSLIAPKEKGDKAYLMRVMQNDLMNYFGYSAYIEKKKMPYWRLVASKDAPSKLKATGGAYYVTPGKVATGVTVRNYPMKNFIILLPNDGTPIIDETDISGNIDITLDCIMTDFNQVKKELNIHGLDLIRGEREMEVLIVKCSN
ncbi:redoxin domain-containing protein [Chitinophaga ginsengisoli]|uniref:Uncharacterized protein (TIGR03435 family) n=1 Tax=Chitinophaga ginsengisoli TaxID=363837 RepID=A0A2P8G292_9BACT|nr:redoxin domain-containing protein [Chitinophaga ginsengisoli]PSL28093.1 uncharacterized protein (TIGR03435 family) [Chitinophaga ginsengisoli]